MVLKTNLRELKTIGLLLLQLYCGALGAKGQARAPVEQLRSEAYGDEDRSTKLNSVAAAADGGFLLFSSTESAFTSFNATPEPPEGLQVVRIAADGRLIWAQTFTKPTTYSTGPVLATPDGGFLISGNVDSVRTDTTKSARGNSDFWVARLDAQGVRRWEKAFGGIGTDVLHTVVATADGGFLLAGISFSDKGFEKSDDARGERSPARKRDPLQSAFFIDTRDAHIVDFWIVRIDAAGNKLWDKTYGGASKEWISAVVATADGGFLLGGTSRSDAGFDKSEARRGGKDLPDFWIVRIDAEGNKLWDKTYGGNSGEALNAINPTSDGGFLLAGTSWSDKGFDKSEARRGDHDEPDFWVVRIDAEGKKSWDKTYGGNDLDILSVAVPTADGGFLLSGYSKSGAGFDKSEANHSREGQTDFWVLRMNAEGAKLWDRTYGGNNLHILDDILQTPDGGFFLSGAYRARNRYAKKRTTRSNSDSWVARMDAKGNPLWEQTFGGPKSESPGILKAVPGAKNEYLLAGTASVARPIKNRERLQYGYRDLWTVKFRDRTASTALYRVSPESAAAPGRLSVEFCGSSFSPQTEFRLIRRGKTLKPRGVEVVSPYFARCAFDLYEADTGVWSGAASNAPARWDTLKNALTVEVFSPRARIDDAPAQRAERWNEYRLALSDTFFAQTDANGPEWGAPVWLVLPEQAAPYQLSFQVAGAQPLETAWEDFAVDWAGDRWKEEGNWRDKKPPEYAYMLPLYLPYLPPGKTVHLRLRAPASYADRDFEVRAWTRTLDADAGFHWFAEGCISTKLSLLLTAAGDSVEHPYAGIHEKRSDEMKRMENWRTCAARAARETQRAFRQKALDGRNQPETFLTSQQEFYFDAFERTLACMGDKMDSSVFRRFRASAPKGPGRAFSESISRSSLASFYNQERASNKPGRMRPLSVNHQYLIRFENETGAPAREAFIKAELNSAFFDLATFRFGPAGFGDALFAAENYADSMSAEIDLRPGAGHFLRATGKLGRAASAAEWRFATLDRKTMQAVRDPRAGLIPPGASSDAAAGAVYFTIQPKAEPPVDGYIFKYTNLIHLHSPKLFTY